MNSLTAAPDAAGPSASATARTSRDADDHPVGDPPHGGRLLRRADAEPHRNGHRRLRAHGAHELGKARRQLVPLARHAGVGDDVDEALARSQIRRRRSAGVVGATSGTSAMPASRSASPISPASLERQVGDDRARGAGVGEQAANSPAPRARTMFA